jgi:transcriptional regulator with XRE-family HTH domain
VAKHPRMLADIGDRIRIARERKGYTQARLGRMLGVSAQLVQAYEKGHTPFGIDRLGDVAECLAVTPAWLMGSDRHRIIHPLRATTTIRLGFYGRPARGAVVEADAHVLAACGLPADAPTEQAWELWLQRIHSDDHALVSAELARLEDPRDGVFNMRYRLVGVDGVERLVIDYGRMLFDAKGEPTRLRGIMLDITHMSRTDTTEDEIMRVLMPPIRNLLDVAINVATAVPLIGTML